MMLTDFEEKKVLMPARITDNIVEMYKIFLFICLFIFPSKDNNGGELGKL